MSKWKWLLSITDMINVCLRKLTKDDGNENLEWTINYIIVNLEMELYL